MCATDACLLSSALNSKLRNFHSSFPVRAERFPATALPVKSVLLADVFDAPQFTIDTEQML